MRSRTREIRRVEIALDHPIGTCSQRSVWLARSSLYGGSSALLEQFPHSKTARSSSDPRHGKTVQLESTMHTTTPDESCRQARKERKDITAEAISPIADRWIALAQRVRPSDKQLALAMMKDAEKLQAHARTIERDAKRRRRANRRREETQWERLQGWSGRSDDRGSIAS